MIVRDLLKAGVISQIYVAEGVNGSFETKVLGQWVGPWSRVGVGRVRVRMGWSGRDVEW